MIEISNEILSEIERLLNVTPAVQNPKYTPYVQTSIFERPGERKCEFHDVQFSDYV